MKWNRSALDLTDGLNSIIWAGSAEKQRTLQSPRHGQNGDVGGMQGLVGPEALPWVPDIVGAS
jgi:hypothetical protein